MSGHPSTRSQTLWLPVILVQFHKPHNAIIVSLIRMLLGTRSILVIVHGIPVCCMRVVLPHKQLPLGGASNDQVTTRRGIQQLHSMLLHTHMLKCCRK